MNKRANQGGSAVVYGIIGILLVLGVIGAVYAVQKRADGGQVAPMDIAAQLDPSKQKEDKEKAAREQAAKEESSQQKSSEEQSVAEQQAAEEKKAQQQRREAAAEEARQQEATEKKAAEQKAEQQRIAAEKTPDAPTAQTAPQQMPTTGGPASLPKTGPADLVMGAFVLLVLGFSIVKYSFSHKFVTGR